MELSHIRLWQQRRLRQGEKVQNGTPQYMYRHSVPKKSGSGCTPLIFTVFTFILFIVRCSKNHSSYFNAESMLFTINFYGCGLWKHVRRTVCYSFFYTHATGADRQPQPLEDRRRVHQLSTRSFRLVDIFQMVSEFLFVFFWYD